MSDARPFVRRHRLLLALLVPALGIRLLATVTYWPALLFWRDSWSYLDAAGDLRPPEIRVLGYSVVLRGLDVFGTPGVVVLVQHLTGVAIGIGIYALLLSRDIPKWGAALAAAPVLLDGHQIDIEQFLLAETLFSALLLAVLWLTLRHPGIGPVRAAALGAAVAAIVLTRSVALPILLIVGVHLLLRRVPRASLIAFALAAMLPLSGYLAWFSATHGSVGFSLVSGRLLYGKTAQFADCTQVAPAQRELCPSTPSNHRLNADFYSFGPASPAVGVPFTKEGDRRLGAFARGVVVGQPLGYARAVGTDLVHYAGARRVQRMSDQRLLYWQFPTGPTPPFTVGMPGRAGYAYARLERAPGGPTVLLRAYQRVTVPGTVLALCGAVTVAAACRRRGAPPLRADGWRADLLLLGAVGLVLVLVPAMTVSLDYRFLLPELVVAPVGAALAVRSYQLGQPDQPVRSTAKATAPSITASTSSSWSSN